MTKVIWEYDHVSVLPGESWYDMIRKKGKEGWEPWQIEKAANGYREIHFKRAKEVNVVLTSDQVRDINQGTAWWFVLTCGVGLSIIIAVILLATK